MRILHLGKYFFPDSGGVERATYAISKEAVKSGHDVTVVVFNSSNEYKKEIIDGIKIIRLPKISKIFRAPFTIPIIGLIEKINPDLIHLHIPNPWFEFNLLVYLIFNPNSKVVVTYHSDVVNYTPIHFFGNFIRYIYLLPMLKIFCRKIIATSPNYVRDSFILSSLNSKVSVIPLSINVSKFKTKDKIKSDKIKLLFVGRLFPYKGLNYLLEAIKIVSKAKQKFILYIVGDGELKENLKKQTKSLMIDNFVMFVGKLSDKGLLKYYNSCDIFILPSIYKSEAFGIVQLEAMAFGKPIISTNISGSGVSYVNINNFTGKVVQPRDSKALANAIVELMNNKNLRIKMGINAKERVKNYFNEKKMIKNTFYVYNEVLKGD